MMEGKLEVSVLREGPNRILQSRNPEGYFWHPAPEYFQSRVSPRFCFKISDPEIQTRLIPYPEKPLRDPLKRRSCYRGVP